MNAQRWLAAVAVVLVCTGMLAQRVAETVQVTIIEIPVTVAGSDGKPVRGLTKDAFEVFDNGKRVPVEYFEVPVKLVGRTAADAQGSGKLLFDFTPEGLKAGEHELRFSVKPNEGTESVVTLPFRVL